MKVQQFLDATKYLLLKSCQSSFNDLSHLSVYLLFPLKEYKVEVVLKENWKDPRLAYGNASWFVRLKGNTLAKVWYPDTMIENSRKHEVDDKTRTAYLFGDGTIFMSEW